MDTETTANFTTGTIRKKGRGVGTTSADEESRRYEGRAGRFDKIETTGTGPCPSIEGWIIFLTDIHEEAQEEDVLDLCSEYGSIKNFHMNLDRRTGFIKGYALVEYETFEDAKRAIENLEGASVLGQKIHANWAFVKGYPVC
ncbi:RNA-binding protein [Blastocystis sp. subtype 4]|uniref:RNA-binding protein n=1 Tax=Blastocystis sp. subtype 4 TaxID=944170 RepID=UPI000711F1A3|nr:RNA-binding protein [Blastocystis sp. subtype 4]KNB42936.1 RNA-binding protein [Blastocystis sp. subtype 4]|eukprot:XP_014526379.1 RNA-binding protein [Blastocystis sp. subtype 4]